MMCEHDMSAKYEVAFCKHCHLTENEISLTKQLAAVQAELAAERENHNKYVALHDADVDRIVTCAYCGQHFEGETPSPGSDRLTLHIKVCEKHPMRAIEQRAEQAEHDNALLIQQNKEAYELVKKVISQREQAEAQCVMMRCCGNCRNSGRGNPFTGVCRYCENNSEWEIKAGVDLENGALSTITRIKRMEGALRWMSQCVMNYDYEDDRCIDAEGNVVFEIDFIERALAALEVTDGQGGKP